MPASDLWTHIEPHDGAHNKMFPANITRRWTTRTLALFILFFSFQPALASVSRRVSLAELVDRSTSIVVATCSSVHSRWTPDRSQIETVALYNVVETLKGPSRQRLTVVTLGGVVDGVGMYVSGMPAFVQDRRELLFLTASDASSMKVVGMAQGQFHISPDAHGSALVTRSLNDTHLIGPKDQALETQQLDALSTMIRRRLGK